MNMDLEERAQKAELDKQKLFDIKNKYIYIKTYKNPLKNQSIKFQPQNS